MKAVIDTNVWLVAIAPANPLRSVFTSFVQEKFTLALTTDILAEYEEVISSRNNFATADAFIHLLLEAKNSELFSPTYFWNLIHQDPDGNKFVDCAIAANADYIVTNDSHFDILKQIQFPKVEIISAQEFVALLQSI